MNLRKIIYAVGLDLFLMEEFRNTILEDFPSLSELGDDWGRTKKGRKFVAIMEPHLPDLLAWVEIRKGSPAVSHLISKHWSSYRRSGSASKKGMEIRGPQLWRRLHRFALNWDGQEISAVTFLEKFLEYIQCGECRNHWIELVLANPPDLSSAEAFFLWTINRHNDVNETLKKSMMSAIEAYDLYFSAVEEPVIPRQKRANSLLVDIDERNRRRAICTGNGEPGSQCKFFRDGVCAHLGCRVAWETRLGISSCPINLW